MGTENTYSPDIKEAIKSFWKTKQSQRQNSTDDTNRGAVVGGKQLDGFIALLKKISIDEGVPENCIFTKNNFIPGFFRASKNWDFLIISPDKKLIAVVELKSIVGSYGNNLNNRTEEAIGSAVDLWTAFRKNTFPNQQAPWVGYMMIIGKDAESTRIVKNNEPHFPVLHEFKNASYIKRYEILCRKLILERHYTSTCLLWTSDEQSFGNISDDISINSFINSFRGYIHGIIDDFG